MNKSVKAMAMITGRCTYTQISRAESLALPDAWAHCVHVMIHAPLPNTHLFDRVPVKHAVMMQMRFDGRLGFPGGYVDPTDVSLEDALLRELSEEMGQLPKNLTFSPPDRIFTHTFEEKRLCMHFYAKKVTASDFQAIEERTKSNSLNFESLGAIRVPLFIMSDKRGGLPAFLRNNFIGNSKQQLLKGLVQQGLLDEDFLSKAVHFSQLNDLLSSTQQ